MLNIVTCSMDTVLMLADSGFQSLSYIGQRAAVPRLCSKCECIVCISCRTLSFRISMCGAKEC